MYNENLSVAYKKSDEVLSCIPLSQDQIVSTSSVLEYLERSLDMQIEVMPHSFEGLGIEEKYGAMMLVEIDESEHAHSATIVLNTDNNELFQRFSLLHELGHLATMSKEEMAERKDNYIVSTHIHYKITNISEKDYGDSSYLLREQIANIFALRVLMPSKIFYDKALELKNIASIAAFFGVTPEAVISRMQIGA